LATESNLAIGAYLLTLKGTGLWGGKRDLLEQAGLPYHRTFEAILSSCLSGPRAAELTGTDLLSSPFPALPQAVRSKGYLALHPYHSRISGYQKAAQAISGEKIKWSANAQNPDEKNSKRPMDASVQENIDYSINKAAKKYNLPPNLIKGIIKAESDFQVSAESPSGARGLMQLMPGTAEELGVTDPFDIDQNIDGGTRYLRNMLDLFDGDLRKALAAYNAGPGTVSRNKGNVPYEETRLYVERVLKFASQIA
jgi:soluble lytic murein transglycosylase-like protein